MNIRPARKDKGKWYFSKEAERRFFFIMTLIMLAAGIIVKIVKG